MAVLASLDETICHIDVKFGGLDVKIGDDDEKSAEMIGELDTKFDMYSGELDEKFDMYSGELNEKFDINIGEHDEENNMNIGELDEENDNSVTINRNLSAIVGFGYEVAVRGELRRKYGRDYASPFRIIDLIGLARIVLPKDARLMDKTKDWNVVSEQIARAGNIAKFVNVR